jgi:SAM-dependent methyltransferase
MIAPAILPAEYEAWNRRWNAPHGKSVPFGGPLSWSLPALWFRGPFAVQPNSETRRFEYPWAYDQLRRLPRRSVLVEVGGGLSGFQFVLARDGYDVTNVDPGMAAKGRGWAVTPGKHKILSYLFRGPAKLIPSVLEDAEIPARSVDGIVSISTLEHLTPADLENAAKSIERILKPNGVVVLTVDLFLDVFPFTPHQKNQWGTNIDIRSFLDRAGLKLTIGDRHQLFGFPEFDPGAILERRHEFLSGGNSVAFAQCLVAAPR